MALPAWIPSTSRVVVQSSQTGSWSGAELSRQIVAIAVQLRQRHRASRVVGLLADNSPHWIAIDLAAQCAGSTLVPLPDFFSASQLAHVVAAAGIDVLFCADPERARSLGFDAETATAAGLRMFGRNGGVRRRDAILTGEEIQKITFTSGTTGVPKGVCLTVSQQLDAARALADVIGASGIRRHLTLLPLPVLLENVAGIYAALLMGARCICPPLADVGWAGASRFDAERCLDAIGRFKPDSVILLPQMLQALVTSLEARAADDPRIRSLKFAAVGGARTPISLIRRARAAGLPVYEGYGLSECASVVTLNVPGADKPGSVGRALPGMRVRQAADGELQVAGRRFAGYLGTPQSPPETWLNTGDLGSCDADGFISITGRKKNILITSFGRNVSPEWPEGILLESPVIAQAAVFGEARPHLTAVVVAASHIDDSALERAVDESNRELPDYARIRGWIRACAPFTPHNGLATPNGRIRRDAVWSLYAARLNELYQTESENP